MRQAPNVSYTKKKLLFVFPIHIYIERDFEINQPTKIVETAEGRSVTKMSVEEAEPPQYIVTAPGEEKNDEDDDKSSTTTTTSTATAQSTATAVNIKTNKAHNTRSQSLQSSTTAVATTDQSTANALSLVQQLKAQSSINIVTEKHVQKFSSSQTTTTSGSSSTSTSGIKSKFTSFLQHPDTSVSSHGATFLTAQQKHVRQFVRSTSAHSSTDSTVAGISISGKSEKCIRSTSQQIDDDHHSFNLDYSKGLQQSAAILISKSAETIEGFRSCSSTSGSMRTQLTLSGGFLAPPNRKLTILSPVHAPPGLQELLKKHRSPLSPRISFPGTEAELFP